MKISARGRYALAAAISLAGSGTHEDHTAVVNLAARLGISKIYLEQVFTLLKRGGIVRSAKGSQGGYSLARAATQITALDVLGAVETSLLEPAGSPAAPKDPEIEQAMQNLIFTSLDAVVRDTLAAVSLQDLQSAATALKQKQDPMYYI